MKKNILFSVAVLFVFQANAQFYIDARGGYALPYPPVELMTPATQIGRGELIENPDGTQSFAPIFGNNGGGINFGLNGGYFINKHISFELGVNYISSGKILEARTNTEKYFAEQYGRTVGVILTPGVAVHTGGEVWDFFAKVGGFIPVYGVLYSEATIRDQEGRLAGELLGAPQPIPGFETNVDAKARSESHFSAGIASGLGVRRYFGKHWNVFSEINFITLTLKAKETRYIDFEQTTFQNGNLFNQESLDDLSEYRIAVIYKDVLDANSNNITYGESVDLDKPNELASFRRSFHSVNFAIGIGFKF